MRIVVVLGSVIALAILWVGLLGITGRIEEDEIEQISAHTQRKVAALASAVQATIDYYDLALLTARDTVLQGTGNFVQQSQTISEHLAVPDGALLYLVEDDHIVSSSSSGPIPRSYIGDRNYFHLLSRGNDNSLIIDPPVINRISSTRIVPFARGVFRDGKLTNILVLTIPVSALQKRLEHYLEHSHEIMSVLTPDGQFILRTNNSDEVFGKRALANRPYLQQPELKNGSFITTETSDSTAQLIVWARLPGGQIAVSSLSLNEALAPVKQSIHWLKFVGSAVSALILLLDRKSVV
jgi:hypothetical protein